MIDNIISKIKQQDSDQALFHQAVYEVLSSLKPFLDKNPQYLKDSLLERLVEPERVVIFRVSWVDDKGNTHVNRGFRVQMSSVIGPYKGGLRFHPSVNLSVLKFLAFEQIFKNSLTTLPLGGGKGGSDFDPKGKSEAEIMRFCQAFMTELYRHIGNETDVPAGDIGVGAREVGYLYGQYKRITNKFSSVITGKDITFGGSLIRLQATGYGTVYFIESLLKTKKLDLKNKKVVVSGSGNVALYACQKLVEKEAKVLTLSDSNGYLFFKNGITEKQLNDIITLKVERRERLSTYVDSEKSVLYFPNKKPWDVACDIAIPCATQNEINESDAILLLSNGCYCVAEGANMPCNNEAIGAFLKAKILFGPGKASNAGGVATSGLEMSQNSLRLSWSDKEIDNRLKDIMQNIHESCVENGRQKDGFVNYVSGANIAGFKKLAKAMIMQGVV